MANFLILQQKDIYVRSSNRYSQYLDLPLLAFTDIGAKVDIGYANISVVKAQKGGTEFPNFEWKSGQLVVWSPNNKPSYPTLEAGVYEVELSAGYNSVILNVHYVEEDFIDCDDLCILSGREGESSLPICSGDDSVSTALSYSWTEKPEGMKYVESGLSGNTTSQPTKQQTLWLRNWYYDRQVYGGDNLTGAEKIWKVSLTRGSASKTVTFKQEQYNALNAEVISSIPTIQATKQDICQPIYIEMELTNFGSNMELESVELEDGEVTEIRILDFGYFKSNKFYAVIGVMDDALLSEGLYSLNLKVRNTDTRELTDVDASFKVVYPSSSDYVMWDNEFYYEPVYVFDDKVHNPTEWENIYLTTSANAAGVTEPDNFYEGLPDFVYFEGNSSKLIVRMNVKTAEMIEDEYVFPFYFYANGVRYKSPVDITLRRGSKVRIRENNWLKRNAKNIYYTPNMMVPVGSKQFITVDYTGRDTRPSVDECGFLRHVGVGYYATEVDVVIQDKTVTKTWEVTIPSAALGGEKSSGFYLTIGNTSDATIVPANEVEYITANHDFYVNFPYRVKEEEIEYFTGFYYTGQEITFDAPENVTIEVLSTVDNGDGTMTMRGSILVSKENEDSYVIVNVSCNGKTVEKFITVLPPDIGLTVDLPREVTENTLVPFTVNYETGKSLAFMSSSTKVHFDVLSTTENEDGSTTANCTLFVDVDNADDVIMIDIQDGIHIFRENINIISFSVPITVTGPDELEEEDSCDITISYTDGRVLEISGLNDDVDLTLKGDVSNGDGTRTAQYSLYVYEEYEDATLVLTISDGVETTTKTINIVAKEPEEPEQPEEPDIPMAKPTISFSKGLNLNFPKSGASRTITVTYTNTSETRINDPLSTDFSCKISRNGEPVISGDSIVIDYTATVSATVEKKDLLPMIFSCMGLDGSSTTEILYGTQEGEEPDESGAYVRLDSYVHVFPASGGTCYVNADFSYPGGSGLSVRVANTNGVYPIAWCDAELEGGGVDDDGTEAHESWKITMDGSTITEPFAARITFSYTNYYGDRGSAEFIAIREASDGEAETFEPDIQPYVTKLQFKVDGTNDIQHIDYFNVMYQDFATGTIETPISDVGWFRVVRSEQQSSTADGILMRYYYEVDPNELTVARAGVVTCYGNVNGIRYTATISLLQARLEIPDDDDDDDPSTDTGDIPVVEGTYIGQIWKDVEFNFGSQNPATYTIYMGDELIYSGKSYKRPGETSNKVLINKIVQDYMDQPQLDLDSVAWYVNTKEFTLRNADGTRISHTYIFVNDWSYSDDFKTGNLSHHILNKQRAVRGQMYPFSIFAAGQQVSMEYGVRYVDGYSDEYGRPIEDWWSTEYITKGVSTDFFPVARRDAKYIDSVYVGDDVYYPEEPSEIPFVLYYVNPWGGFDWFPVTGKVTVKDNLTQYKYTKNYLNTSLDFGNRRYLTSIDRNYIINTNWLTQEESERMWYLLESNVVYLHDIKADKIYPVLISDTEVEHKKRNANQKLINYTFTCQLSHNRKRL